MKTELKISLVLTWINLILWGFIVFCGLLLSFGSGNMIVLVPTFLIAAIVLHSYASLKLHKSIRYPNIPLSDQTPVGIRFVGFIALFLGITYVGSGVQLISSSAEAAKATLATMPAQIKDLYKNIDLTRMMRIFGVFIVLTGASVAVNVLLNFRLLRWYYLVKQSDVS
jgi:hypothetical protein